MRIHITNINGFVDVAMKAQNRTARVAREELHCNELGIFCYDVDTDTPEMLCARLDGIPA